MFQPWIAWIIENGLEMFFYKIMIICPHVLETSHILVAVFDGLMCSRWCLWLFNVLYIYIMCVYVVSTTINNRSPPLFCSSVQSLSGSDLCLCLLSNCVIQLKLLERNVNRQGAVLLSSSRKQNATELRTPWKLLYTGEGVKLIPLTFTCRRQKQDSFPAFRTSTRS